MKIADLLFLRKRNIRWDLKSQIVPTPDRANWFEKGYFFNSLRPLHNNLPNQNLLNPHLQILLMTLKLNLSHKGKTWKIEVESSILAGKSLGDKIQGKEIKPELEGYELKITGGSDFAGFPMKKDVEGIGLKRVLLTKGWGMHKRPRGDKKKVPQPKGLRLRKTVRGKTISEKTIQVNMNILKQGSKKLKEIFPEQNKPKVVEPKPESPKPTETPKEPEKKEPKPETPAPEQKPEEEKKE